ncbi:MAG: BON domain-containing protein [Chloroflexi bacterium]|nr:BON domain-containing protein [Chloroflexota bacterium]
MEVGRRPDDLIIQDIRDTLAWDVRLDDSNVAVDVTEGTVTLSGTVRTFSEKTVAIEDAWKIKGVKNVVDGITVAPEGPRLDADIMTDIVNTLKADNRLDERNVALRVNGSVVELSGTVATLAEKEAAEEDAWFTAGVVDVANYIEVSPTRVRSDAEIEDDVRTAISRDARILDTTRISASSSKGKVTLRGQVSSAEERRAAEEDARFTAGVVEVRNELTIGIGLSRPSIM